MKTIQFPFFAGNNFNNNGELKILDPESGTTEEGSCGKRDRLKCIC
jgi:hypothetical protein